MAAEHFFHPNVCHICKEYRNEGLIDCANCHMISYCSSGHLIKHYDHHIDICHAIQEVLEGRMYMNTDEITIPEWSTIRHQYVERVEKKLGRKLQPEEWQMIMNPKACVVCHRQDELIQCGNCLSVNFCIKHSRDTSEHNKNCELIYLAFRIQKFNVDHPSDTFVLDDRKFDASNVYDMRSFLDACEHCHVAEDNKYLLDIKYSEETSVPLTIHFSMKQMNYPSSLESLIVHIIAPKEHISFKDMHVWRILFLFWCKLESLTIIYVGSELMYRELKSTYFINILRYTNYNVNYFKGSYHNYMREKDFQRPDLIVGYNAVCHELRNNTNRARFSNGIPGTSQEHHDIPGSSSGYRDISTTSRDDISGFVNPKEVIDPLTEFPETLPEQSCPCILSFDWEFIGTTGEKIKQNESVFCGKNKYASLEPYIDYVTGKTYFSNKSVIIMKNLKSNLVFVTNANRCGLILNT